MHCEARIRFRCGPLAAARGQMSSPEALLCSVGPGWTPVSSRFLRDIYLGSSPKQDYKRKKKIYNLTSDFVWWAVGWKKFICLFEFSWYRGKEEGLATFLKKVETYQFITVPL